MTAPRDTTEERMQRVGAVVIAAAILLAGVGVVVGILVGPLGFIGVALGLVALVVAREYVRGPPRQRDHPRRRAGGRPLLQPLHPYARED